MKGVIAFILVFGIIVLVHEFGHYFFAKRAGILVREFSIGMGPKLFWHRSHGTTYTIRILPLGGYVRMAGTADDEDELEPGTMATLEMNDQGVVTTINTSDKATNVSGIPVQVAKSDLEKELWIEGYENGDESSLKRYSVDHDALIVEKDGTVVQIAPLDVQFQSASLPKRMLTNFGGPLNNFLLGIITFMIMAFVNGGAPNTDQTMIAQVQADSPAMVAGLHTKDIVEKVDGKAVAGLSDFSKQIQGKADQDVQVQVLRNGRRRTLTVKPHTVTQEGKKVTQIGVVVSPGLDTSFMAKVKYGFTETWYIITHILQILGSFFTGGFSLNKLGGPVAIYQASSQAASFGWISVVTMMASLSVNLGLMNLLPIPALDGGKLLLNIIEGVRGKPISEEKEGVITLIGFGLLLLLMVAVTWNDFQRLFTH
ncbi:RIP metalloprotease RseP [Schleiferilactobacillus perolens]|uniref:Zinc metalloprotease n=1 Tax=Schleiferilactobacillus perolens DSM 12744 TaxID=1423792 RepID=A0A0R1MXP8_9LACO|nr:RIP metalloprotease RseP [Schleiferilactobacillus perolens]KRL12990.1 RIP metalloprotease RseP [Schleiferilactobacillus perolens DSM 12744]